ncbi:MAG: hypothetical protein ACRDPR_09200 [Nocardioidaceae bacterium]
MPAPYRQLVDDAAIFPPGNAPLSDAVPAHREHLASPHADLVGPFVVGDVRLPDLIEMLRADPSGGPLAVSVVVTGGAGAIEPAVRWASCAEELTLAAVELGLRDEEDLPRNARRVTTVVDQLRVGGDLDDETPVYVEPARPTGPEPSSAWLTALDEVAAAGLRLKFRTGGADERAFPSSEELAASIDAALDRELAFKCTAGLHRAIRHRDAETGFEHHGFLNVLAATRAALDGGAASAVTAILEDHDPADILDLLGASGPEALVSARRWFTSFGSCSVLDPLADLVALDLLPPSSHGSETR